MAGLRFKWRTSTALSPSTKAALCSVHAPANQRVHITQIHLSANGTNTSWEPILIQYSITPSGGTTTNVASVKAVASDSETIQTVIKTYSAAPSDYGTEVETIRLHPSSLYAWQAAFDDPIVITGGGIFMISATSANSVTFVTSLKLEE